jgi:peptidoglycan/LPS O-acetylase OafA/YrhL
MKRLYSLDALRGVAALSVVIWHWQHFYAMSGEWLEGWQRPAQPFYRLIEPLYLQGWAAVDLFFALSGFVFFWLYSAAIREGQVKPGRFALLRFSRLYPLHFLTLIAALLVQRAFFAETGDWFIFPAEGWDRFFANLFLVQQWVPPNIDQTFNGPAWTVSIEAGLYVLFFILCRLGFNGPKSAALVAVAGIFLFNWNAFIARGMMGFFLGGLCWFAVMRIRASAHARNITAVLVAASLALWWLTFYEILHGPLHAMAAALLTHLPAGVNAFYAVQNERIYHLLYIFGVIPVSVIALALTESVWNLAPLNWVYRMVSKLGDISFSTYMIHFPLQVACALSAFKLGLTPHFFEHPLVMLGFYAVLIVLGALSFYLYEKPVQKLLRRLVD